MQANSGDQLSPAVDRDGQNRYGRLSPNALDKRKCSRAGSSDIQSKFYITDGEDDDDNDDDAEDEDDDGGDDDNDDDDDNNNNNDDRHFCVPEGLNGWKNNTHCWSADEIMTPPCMEVEEASFSDTDVLSTS
ncbi:hypothetical protein FHG87_016938 [Trinorchestia longiramus]|nr:hypothetical protein FHG87_016938 [Trinorchestia longiramus]